MRRPAHASHPFTFFAFAFFGVACHSTQAAPPAPSVKAEASTLAAPLDPMDPAALSGAAEDVAQIDPSLTFTPDGTVVVAWTSLRGGGAPSVVRARFSRDGGSTWETTQTLAAPDGRSSLESTLAIDAAGDVYIAWLSERDMGDGGAGDSHVYVARADAGGTSFGPATELSNETHKGAHIHKPWMTSTGKGTVLVTWSYTHPNGDGIGIATKKDGGTWVRGVVIERIDLGARFPYICASPHDAHAWLAYLDSQAGIRLRASDDEGESWAPARVATVSLPDDRGRIAFETPVCSGEGEDVTVAFALTHAAPVPDGGARAVTDTVAASSIVVARSIDGGRSFDIRRSFEAGSQLVLDPQIAREPDGTTDTAFYVSNAPEHAAHADAEALAASDAATLRWVHMDERGVMSATKIARDHLRFESSSSALAWPGDYFGWTWNDGALFVASVDNTEGKPHVAFARLAGSEARPSPSVAEHPAHGGEHGAEAPPHRL